MPIHGILVQRNQHIQLVAHAANRSEEHTSELQSQSNLVCRLLLEKKKKMTTRSREPMDFSDTRGSSPPYLAPAREHATGHRFRSSLSPAHLAPLRRSTALGDPQPQ